MALFEAAKGGLVLLAGFGLLALIHRDVQAAAEYLVARSHLSPAKKYPQIFIDAAASMTDARLWFLASLALFYSIVRFVEAYGLWRERRWAEWFALITAALYLPVEIYELSRRVTGIKIGALIVNAVIVIFMIYVIRQSKRPRGRTFG